MSDEIKNPTRIEQYLSKAAGEDTELPAAPMTRIEQYLAKIAGEDVELPEGTYTRIEEYLETIAENGGGGETVLINNKNISANGEYSASSDGADGYKKVTVSVANTYAAGDEGKVVSGGALVSQTAHAQVTENGTIDTTLNNSVEVAVPAPSGTKQISITQNGTTTENVSGYASAEISVSVSGGGGADLSAFEFAATYEDSGATLHHYGKKTSTSDGVNYPQYSGVTKIIYADSITTINSSPYACYSLTTIEGGENVTELKVGSNGFRQCGALTALSFPKLQTISGAICRQCTSLQTVLFGSVGYGLSAPSDNQFYSCTQAGLTITVYCTGANVDTILSKFRNGATNATIVVKASESTTYGGNSFAAGATILTSTP